MRSTFRILFYVNKQRAKDGYVPIYVRLTVNGKSTFVSSRLTIPLPLWDSTANKAAGKSVEAKRINVELDRIKAKLLHHYQHISDRDAYVTAERVKSAYLGIGEEYETLLEAFDKFNRNFKQHVGVDRAQSTYRKYDNVRKRLAEFLSDKLHREDIPLKEQTETFIKGLTGEMIQRSFDGDLWIVKKRQKTGTPFKIKLCGITKRIIDKYKREVAGMNLVLPVPDIAYCNRVLKKIAAEVGIDKTITFHVRRHTFATTNALAQGIRIEVVSRMLGHTNIKTTQIYAKVTDDMLAKEFDEMAGIYPEKYSLAQ